MQGRKQRRALSLPDARQRLKHNLQTSLQPAPGSGQCPCTQDTCWSPDRAIRICPSALRRNFLLFSSDAHKPLRISAVCSDPFSTSASAGLVRTCLHVPACTSEKRREGDFLLGFGHREGGFLLGFGRCEEPQYSPCAMAAMDLLLAAFSQAGPASARGAASGSHAGKKALTGKHLKHKPGNISLPADPW